MNKNTNDLRVAIPTELYDKFKEQCKSNYKTISEVIRNFVLEYSKKEDK